MARIIIGRQAEQRVLKKLLNSQSAEFLAVYGRRRVGKTYLVRNYFKGKGLFFEITGSHLAKTQEQLDYFHAEFRTLFNGHEDNTPPANWREAFNRLVAALKKLESKQKIILFFDELPWLASPKSSFLSALDYAWNRHFSAMSNILLIVSGSAASWMIRNVIHNTGGLYGRLSAHMRLIPFTLQETEEYLKNRDIELPRSQICEIYMVTGGVPKYLSFLEPGLSSVQNIHDLCFNPQAPLLSEFQKLYHSLFQNAEQHLRIVRQLAKKRRGMTRKDLIESGKFENNGKTSLILQELEESGFITSLPSVGKKKRDINYFLSDEYTLFYLKWIEPEKGTLLRGVEKDYWVKQQAHSSWIVWSAFAFETLCMKHIQEIKEALRIGGVQTQYGYWKTEIKGVKESEIDLVIDRADQCINLCEIKFSHKAFQITKQYAGELKRKKDVFRDKTETKKALFTTLITPYGLKENTWASEVDQSLTMDIFFR